MLPDLTKIRRHFREALWSIAAPLCLACGGGADDIIAPPLPTPDLSIEVRYLTSMTAPHEAVVAAAVERWTRALSKDFGEFRFDSPANECFAGQPPMDETHHNPLVFFSVGDIDGPGGVLAGTQICVISSRDTLPVLTHIRLDRLDMESLESRGILLSVITHELGHALGFIPRSYTSRQLAGGGTADPYFSGPTARAEFAKHGAWYTGVTVPLENRYGGGPNDPHWRFSVFGDEVMSSGIGVGYTSPLSVITLGLFQDLGYDVDLSAADPYEVTPPSVGGNRLLPEFIFANDLQAVTPPRVLTPLALR